jgi:hypothetical protein
VRAYARLAAWNCGIFHAATGTDSPGGVNPVDLLHGKFIENILAACLVVGRTSVARLTSVRRSASHRVVASRAPTNSSLPFGQAAPAVQKRLYAVYPPRGRSIGSRVSYNRIHAEIRTRIAGS